MGAVHYNYVGGTIGGPIKKNKLFFFADYLRSEDHEAISNTETIPSTLSRTGNLSEALAGSNPALVYDPAHRQYRDRRRKNAFHRQHHSHDRA